MSISKKEVETLPYESNKYPFESIEKRIEVVENQLKLLNETYVLLCEQKAHEDAELISNCKGKWIRE